MLHYKNLNKLFFESVPQKATDFIALSGFLGPDPIKKFNDRKIDIPAPPEARPSALHETRKKSCRSDIYSDTRPC